MFNYKFNEIYNAIGKPFSRIILDFTLEWDVSMQFQVLALYFAEYLYPENGWREHREEMHKIIWGHFCRIKEFLPSVEGENENKGLLYSVKIEVSFYKEKIMLKTSFFVNEMMQKKIEDEHGYRLGDVFDEFIESGYGIMESHDIEEGQGHFEEAKIDFYLLVDYASVFCKEESDLVIANSTGMAASTENL
jgi:hypothetical protein